MKLRRIFLVLLIISLIGAVGFCFFNQARIREGSFGSSPDGEGLRMTTLAKVVKVVDGDTIKLESGETVRYLGMDAPEIYEFDNKGNRWVKRDNCYSEEAMNRNKELVNGKTVRLGRDISDKDRYGRLLRYVWIDTDMVNMELVRGGFATAITVPPDTKYEKQIFEVEKEAKEEGRGLWGMCGQ